MSEQNPHLEALQDIRQMMQRSSRFLSLSGLSGIAAGFWALIGAYIAYEMIGSSSQLLDVAYVGEPDYRNSTIYRELEVKLVLLAASVLALALLSAFYFTWRKTKQDNVPLWNHTSRQLAVNTFIPLATGGLFVLALLQHSAWRFIAPTCLVFYGLALVNASKYTLSDVRYLGISEIVLGLISTQYERSGLHFWAIGFGVLHIIYGFIMWWKNERNAK